MPQGERRPPAGSEAAAPPTRTLPSSPPACALPQVIKNNKDFLDQSLDEIKLLRYINAQVRACVCGGVGDACALVESASKLRVCKEHGLSVRCTRTAR